MRVARCGRVRACYNVCILCCYARRALEVNISTANTVAVAVKNTFTVAVAVCLLLLLNISGTFAFTVYHCNK